MRPIEKNPKPLKLKHLKAGRYSEQTMWNYITSRPNTEALSAGTTGDLAIVIRYNGNLITLEVIQESINTSAIFTMAELLLRMKFWNGILKQVRLVFLLTYGISRATTSQ